MVYTLDENKFFRLRHSCEEEFDSIPRAILVAPSLEDEFRLLAFGQKGKIRIIYGDAQTDQLRDA